MARGARLVGLYEILASPDYQLAVSAHNSGSSAVAEVRIAISSMEALLASCERYYPVKDKEVQRLSEQVTAVVSGLVTVTTDERRMIYAAMSVSFHGRSRSQGHWLKCKNGHIYCVTECGEPMERARCPECRAPIGGVNHTYVAGTTVASEMDGSAHLAWSAANDVNNYVLE